MSANVNILTRIFKHAAGAAAPHQQRGHLGEMEAACYLKKRGFKILVRRYRCKLGEIDLVTRENDTLVFVEVKTRSSSLYGEPSQAVTPEKQRHISRVALDYLHRLNSPEIPIRFDIVEVIHSSNHTEYHHITNAFPLSAPYLY